MPSLPTSDPQGTDAWRRRNSGVVDKALQHACVGAQRHVVSLWATWQLPTPSWSRSMFGNVPMAVAP